MVAPLCPGKRSCSSPYWPEGDIADSVENHLVSLHFLFGFLLEQISSCGCSLKMRTPPDEKDQMWSQSSVCLSELVRREKWIDTLLNENKAGVESPLPASTSEWSNLLTAESNKKHFHVQFVSVKNRQCPIFATSSLPYFILNKTLF